MFVFMDESGNVDLPLTQPYFCLSAVAFQTEASRDEMDSTIAHLRNTWGRKLHQEFKFTELGHDGRMRFLTETAALHFRFASCVLRKDRIGNPLGQWKERSYRYERVIQAVVAKLTPHFRNVDAGTRKPLRVHATADQHDDPEYFHALRREFGKLRSRDGSVMLPKGVKPGRSSSSRLIQLADVLAGASRYETDVYRNLLTARCEGIVHVP
jgi:hypothetical protein